MRARIAEESLSANSVSAPVSSPEFPRSSFVVGAPRPSAAGRSAPSEQSSAGYLALAGNIAQFRGRSQPSALTDARFPRPSEESGFEKVGIPAK